MYGIMYRITAHWRGGKAFHATVDALSSQHAGAIFVTDMVKKGHVVGTVTHDGVYRPLLSCETGAVDVVIDRIRKSGE